MDANQRTTKHLTPHIRWMIQRDMVEVLDIERLVFEFPWSEEDFIRVLRVKNCIGMVAELGDDIGGFMIYELHKTKLVILNLAVALRWQGQGVGRAMIDKLRGKLHLERRTVVEVLVRERNLDAQLFFRRLGFKATGLISDAYDDSPEDGIEMVWRHPAAARAEARKG